ncbi:MAG: Flp family type IVb pilin [Pseudomonadota bacterium]|nr:Flp family type IVb pilin [Pseudomonadota bacterium]
MIDLRKIRRDKRGATAIEYALVASLISVAAIAAFNSLGSKLDSTYNNLANAIQ